MSKCAVHMMKLKMSALGGIQSHNQREHESRKNKEIDYDKSKYNFDTVNGENINYHNSVKERIDSLNLKKAVRKDAVVMCSFIVSSDRDFFLRLGLNEWQKKEREANFWDSAYYSSETTEDFKYFDQELQDKYVRLGAKKFFDKATRFFQERYGKDNVICGSVHLDEATPHMHLGVVPITKDNRLSAKNIFTPTELKQLQTDFANDVGESFGLERGQEGSQAKHLDEISFKVKKRTEQLKTLENKCEALEKRSESLNKTIFEKETEISTLEEKKRLIEAKMDAVESSRINILEKFVALPQIKPIFDKFYQTMLDMIEKRKSERLAKWKESLGSSSALSSEQDIKHHDHDHDNR